MGYYRKTTAEFIAQARAKHGDRYDYSITEYTTSQTRLSFICPTHGIMAQLPNDHLNTSGCKKCGLGQLRTEDFIERAKQVHGSHYDYSSTEYKHSLVPLDIVCPEHGKFLQKPSSHLRGNGCPKCGDARAAAKLVLDTDDFIIKAKKRHGERYDYSKAVYVKDVVKLEIICPDHGSFWQTPCEHKRGSGCPDCAYSGFRPSAEATLYYLQVGPAYKIGITGRRVRDRYQLVRDQEQITVLREWRMPGKEAQRIEKEIVERFADRLYEGPQLLYAAFSNEMFREDILDQMLMLYPQLVGTHSLEPHSWNDWPNKVRNK